MNATEKQEEKEVNDLLAKTSKVWRELDGFDKRCSYIQALINEFKNEVVQLINKRDALDAQTKAAAVNLQKVEREATLRLQSVEMGHQAIIEKLSNQEAANIAKAADLEKREIAVAKARQEYELLKHEYETRLAGLTKKK